ncbi:LutC/YkgG family protein [Mucilaginibacter aquariorum]|uniref:LUD domain-containing protein n=1 Tax=Mucilaginibacter aquariorum TaxID=2967225 RepID=A0ABT1SZZ2_9SPHI|nr:LUD domain-containing protein [Mucilaginibacter aquariorum]MCQ6957778.1 LUD domain-containing protein [Mucilaginibacter aquariorum]
MTDREQIINAIAANQPAFSPLPATHFTAEDQEDLASQFADTLTAIGSVVFVVDNLADIHQHIKSNTSADHRVISTIGMVEYNEDIGTNISPHSLQNVEIAVLKAHFGVAENGAVWLTEELMGNRVLPFICQHLMIALPIKDIVANMHKAYERIGNDSYGFGAFIAGPSKTADIEQSLVMGAHGPKTMTIFLMRS